MDFFLVLLWAKQGERPGTSFLHCGIVVIFNNLFGYTFCHKTIFKPLELKKGKLILSKTKKTCMCKTKPCLFFVPGVSIYFILDILKYLFMPVVNIC